MAAKKTVEKRAHEVSDAEFFALCEGLEEGEDQLLREVVARVADKWSLWALSELVYGGPLRFSRLMERVEGVSQKSLTSTLRHLERDGLVSRTVMVQVPIRVDYAATNLGVAMCGALRPLWMWAVNNRKELAAARRKFDRAALAASRKI